MKLKGKAWKFGDNINTDEIISARHLNIIDPAELAKHCMEGTVEHPDFSQKVALEDVIVADRNFGCGSSREHAPIAIQACAVSCVIAKTFARIFYRNAINIGLPILESEDAALNIDEGDQIEVDVATGIITNLTKNQKYNAMPFPEFMQGIIAAGGLMNFVKSKVVIG